MRKPVRKPVPLALAAVLAVALAACQEQPTTPDADVSASHAPAAASAATQNFRADLEPLGDSGVRGTAGFRLRGERLSVQLVARGLEPGPHAQHIHENASCDDFGPVQIPLDFDLGDGDGAADGPFPETSGMSGTLTYSQSASSEAFSGLPLGDKTVVVHATDFAPVACGEIGPVGGGE